MTAIAYAYKRIVWVLILMSLGSISFARNDERVLKTITTDLLIILTTYLIFLDVEQVRNRIKLSHAVDIKTRVYNDFLFKYLILNRNSN